MDESSLRIRSPAVSEDAELVTKCEGFELQSREAAECQGKGSGAADDVAHHAASCS